MASLRGLNGFEVTSTEIVLDRARTRLGESRIFSDIDKWKGFKDKKLKLTSFFSNVSEVYKFFYFIRNTNLYGICIDDNYYFLRFDTQFWIFI